MQNYGWWNYDRGIITRGLWNYDQQITNGHRFNANKHTNAHSHIYKFRKIYLTLLAQTAITTFSASRLDPISVRNS